MSLFVSHPDIPAARIRTYPKRRPSSYIRLAPIIRLAPSVPGADEPCYSDFFATPALVAAAS